MFITKHFLCGDTFSGFAWENVSAQASSPPATPTHVKETKS